MSSDLRDRLSRVSARAVVAPDAFARFDRRRRREVRRQRIATGAFALMLAVVVTAGLVSVVRHRGVGVASPSPTTSTGPQPNVYRDPLGWQIELPTGWHRLRYEGPNPNIRVTGEVFSSSDPARGPGADGLASPNLGSLGPDDVAMIVSHTYGLREMVFRPDSTFPIPWGRGWTVAPGDGPMDMNRSFWLGGQQFSIDVRAGGFDTPPERMRELKQLLASLRPVDDFVPHGVDLKQTLPGTVWWVIAIDGVAVEAPPGHQPMASLSFRSHSHRFGGFDGCNAFEGRYRIVGDRLVVTGLSSTLIGCSRETVLQTAMSAGGTLTLDGDRFTLVSRLHTVTFKRARPTNLP